MRRPFDSDSTGVVVKLRAAERSVLRSLFVVLEGIGESGADPAADRLDPTAYPDDPEADREFRRLMSAEMTSARTADRSSFLDTVDATHLTEEEAEAWVRVIGEARLAIAARSGVVTSGTEWEDRAQTEPDLALVGWLGFVQGSLIEAMAKDGAR